MKCEPRTYGWDEKITDVRKIKSIDNGGDNISVCQYITAPVKIIRKDYRKEIKS
jgi:hypothetical protein